MTRVHFAFGDPVPDLLIDNLVRGFHDAGCSVTWWPDKPWLRSHAPSLRHPMISCWGGAGWGGGPVETATWCAAADPCDLLVASHGPETVTLPSFRAIGVAIDAFDQPKTLWRREFTGARLYERERPAARKQRPIGFTFNPLWQSAQPSPNRPVQVMLAGDFGVGRRAEYASVVRAKNLPSAIVGQLAFPDWLDALPRAAAVVVPHGAGEQTYRLWESAAAGCALIVERFTYPTDADEDLIDGETCLFFTGPEELQARVQTLAWSPDLAFRLGAAAYERAWKRHTPQSQAERILRGVGLRT